MRRRRERERERERGGGGGVRLAHIRDAPLDELLDRLLEGDEKVEEDLPGLLSLHMGSSLSLHWVCILQGHTNTH